MRPRSAHSMARAQRLPASMVSTPSRSQMSLSHMISAKSSISQRPPKTNGGLVLGTLHHEALVATLEHGVALDALEHAGRARLVDGPVLGEHGLDGDALEVLHRALAPVARGERVDAVHDAHHVEGAAALVRRRSGVVLGAFDEVADHGLEVVRPRDLDLLLAVPDDALEVLGAVDGAGAAAAELVPVVVVDAGEAHEPLAGLADDARLGLLVRRARQDLVLGLERVHAPQVGGVVELRPLFADLEVDRAVGLALDDHDLVAGACANCGVRLPPE